MKTCLLFQAFRIANIRIGDLRILMVLTKLSVNPFATLGLGGFAPLREELL